MMIIMMILNKIMFNNVIILNPFFTSCPPLTEILWSALTFILQPLYSYELKSRVSLDRGFTKKLNCPTHYPYEMLESIYECCDSVQPLRYHRADCTLCCISLNKLSTQAQISDTVVHCTACYWHVLYLTFLHYIATETVQVWQNNASQKQGMPSILY